MVLIPGVAVCEVLLVGEALTAPFATYAVHPSVSFYVSGRGKEEVVAGLLLAAILLGLAALVVINGLRQSVHRTT